MKVAVVLSGGGCKGAFTAGVIKGMLRKVDEFVCAYGSSTGSLISTCIASKKYDFMTRVYTEVNVGNIVKPVAWEDIPVINEKFDSIDFSLEAMLGYAFIAKKKSIYSITPLARLIDNNLNFSDLINSSTEVGYLVSNWGHNVGQLISNKNVGVTANMLRKALHASVSIPIFMPPVAIPGLKGKYVDGGLTRHLPGVDIFNAKRYAEADLVLFVSTSPEFPDVKKSPKNIGEIIIHTLLGLSDSCDANSLELEIAKVKNKVEQDGKMFILVRPTGELNFDSALDFTPVKMKRAYSLGIEKAQKEINTKI